MEVEFGKKNEMISRKNITPLPTSNQNAPLSLLSKVVMCCWNCDTEVILWLIIP